MSKTRLYTRDEVRKIAAGAAVFGFDKGVRAFSAALVDDGVENVHSHPFYKNITKDTWKQFELDD